MPLLDDLIKERDEAQSELQSLHKQAGRLVELMNSDEAPSGEALERLENSCKDVTEQRNSVAEQIETLEARIEPLNDAREFAREQFKERPQYSASEPIDKPTDENGSPSSGNAMDNIHNFAQLLNQFYGSQGPDKDAIGSLFSTVNRVPVVPGAGENLSLSKNSKDKEIWESLNTAGIGQGATSGSGQIQREPEMMYGLEVARASGYLSDMFQTIDWQSSTSTSWNEPEYNSAASAFWRASRGGTPTEYLPEAGKQSIVPKEFAIEIPINIADARANPNIGDLAQQELSKAYRTQLSQQMGHLAYSANEYAALGHVSFTGNGLIDSTADRKAANWSLPNVYNLLRTQFVSLQGQWPGQKTCLILRELLEDLAQVRSNGILQYPRLSEGETPTERGITYVPIDVGLAAMPGTSGAAITATNALCSAITLDPATVQILTSGMGLSLMTEIERRLGNHILLLDGTLTWRARYRYAIARLRLIRT